jgi:hypothetical protein
MHFGLNVKYRYCSLILTKTEFLNGLRQKYSTSGSRKSAQLEPSCSIRTNGRTDVTKLTGAFRNYAKSAYKHKLQKILMLDVNNSTPATKRPMKWHELMQL